MRVWWALNDFFFIANFLVSVTVKEFGKLVNIFGEVMGTSLVSYCFLTHGLMFNK